MADAVDMKYSDTSDLLERKVASRRKAARLSFGEKIVLVENLRANLAPFKKIREDGIAAQKARSTPYLPSHSK
jgi:hypothetical protein